MSTVFVCIYEHKYGTDTTVYASLAGAESYRKQIAVESWENMFDAPKPADNEIADAYWQRMSESGREWFGINETEVLP